MIERAIEILSASRRVVTFSGMVPRIAGERPVADESLIQGNLYRSGLPVLTGQGTCPLLRTENPSQQQQHEGSLPDESTIETHQAIFPNSDLGIV